MCESLGVIAKFLYNRNLPFEQGIWIVKLESKSKYILKTITVKRDNYELNITSCSQPVYTLDIQ